MNKQQAYAKPYWEVLILTAAVLPWNRAGLLLLWWWRIYSAIDVLLWSGCSCKVGRYPSTQFLSEMLALVQILLLFFCFFYTTQIKQSYDGVKLSDWGANKGKGNPSGSVQFYDLQYNRPSANNAFFFLKSLAACLTD